MQVEETGKLSPISSARFTLCKIQLGNGKEPGYQNWRLQHVERESPVPVEHPYESPRARILRDAQ